MRRDMKGLLKGFAAILIAVAATMILVMLPWVYFYGGD
jgi:hypothetical protein